MYINLKLRLKELLINNISALTSLTILNIIPTFGFCSRQCMGGTPVQYSTRVVTKYSLKKAPEFNTVWSNITRLIQSRRLTRLILLQY
jgi:hypothetical protein